MNWDTIWHGFLRQPYRLHESYHGNPEAPALVLLHGIAASSDDWREVVTLLKDDYYIVTIDLLGFAKSPKPTTIDYSMEDHVRSIAYTIRKSKARKPFILAGHSLGSFLATRYAATHDKNVERLLLLSPPVYPSLPEAKRRAQVRTNTLLKIYELLRTHPALTPATARKFSHLLPLPRTVFTHPETWPPFTKTLEKCIEQQTIRRDIVQTKAPTDIFYGSLDAVVVPANVQSLAKLRKVTLHKFRGNHTIGKAYARTVQRVLQQNEPA